MPQEMSFGEALVSALGEVLEQDRRVVLIGGGLVSSGPAQAQFARLRQKFASRMKSPPIAEIGFCGIAAGAAMAGLRPLCRHRHSDVFLRSDSADRQRSRHRLFQLRRTNQRAGDLFHALRHSRRRRRAAFRQPATVVLEHAGLASGHAIQPGRRQRTCCARRC